MTYREKLHALHHQSLSDQAEFLKIIGEIRKLSDMNAPLDEELLFRRDKVYGQFNKTLKEHRRLLNHIESSNIPMDDEFSEIQ